MVGIRLWNLAILIAIAFFWLASDTQREKALAATPAMKSVPELEKSFAQNPTDPERARALSSAYVDARLPGLAVHTLKSLPDALRALPEIEHAMARAEIEQGHASVALACEKRVLALCGKRKDACSEFLLTSSTRRSVIFQELVDRGIEDPQVHPEAANVALSTILREARSLP
jgi:predicted Zn-dependent protease